MKFSLQRLEEYTKGPERLSQRKGDYKTGRSDNPAIEESAFRVIQEFQGDPGREAPVMKRRRKFSSLPRSHEDSSNEHREGVQCQPFDTSDGAASKLSLSILMLCRPGKGYPVILPNLLQDHGERNSQSTH